MRRINLSCNAWSCWDGILTVTPPPPQPGSYPLHSAHHPLDWPNLASRYGACWRFKERGNVRRVSLLPFPVTERVGGSEIAGACGSICGVEGGARVSQHASVDIPPQPVTPTPLPESSSLFLIGIGTSRGGGSRGAMTHRRQPEDPGLSFSAFC